MKLNIKLNLPFAKKTPSASGSKPATPLDAKPLAAVPRLVASRLDVRVQRFGGVNPTLAQ